jgi:glycosyltransferase involved in cell wall biosynthesis
MKLIYLSHWRFPSGKTTTPFTLRTCEEFAKLGYEVELWIPRRNNPDDHGQDLFELYGIKTRFTVKKLLALDLMHVLGTLGFVVMVASFGGSAFFKLRKEGKGTVVYTQDLRDALLPAFTGLKLFVEIHDFYESSWKFVNRLVLKRASGLIVTNRIKIERLHSAYGFAKQKMLWQPNAVDAEFFDSPKTQAEARAELGLPQAGRIVLYTGHLYSWKGVDTLVRAAPGLPAGTSIYIVGGESSDRARLQQLAQDENIQNVAFVEHQPQARVPLYLRAADVLVLPNTAKEDASKFETSPVKLFEYLASGTPTVASDLPSVREIVSESEVYFAKADDPASFAEAITAVLQGGPQVALRTVAGKVFARAHSWQARAKHIDAFIQKNGN